MQNDNIPNMSGFPELSEWARDKEREINRQRRIRKILLACLLVYMFGMPWLLVRYVRPGWDIYVSFCTLALVLASWYGKYDRYIYAMEELDRVIKIMNESGIFEALNRMQYEAIYESITRRRPRGRPAGMIGGRPVTTDPEVMAYLVKVYQARQRGELRRLCENPVGNPWGWKEIPQRTARGWLEKYAQEIEEAAKNSGNFLPMAEK